MKNLVKIRSQYRFGPHNKAVYAVIFGGLLGDAWAEKRKNSTRICFYQENTNVSYLRWLHQFFAIQNYCNPKQPKLSKRIGKNGKVRFYSRFRTWSFQSFNVFHDIFYKQNKKVIPENHFLNVFFSPQSLAIWIMDDGKKQNNGLSIATNCFSKEDLTRLCCFLSEKYNLKVTLNSAGVPQQYVLYFWVSTMPILVKLVKPYMVSSMMYKLGKYVEY